MPTFLIFMLAGVFTAIVGVLAIPLHIRFAASMDDPQNRFRQNASVRWAFGLVDLPVQRSREEKAPRPSRRVRRERKKIRRRLNVKALVGNPVFWRRLKLLLARLSRTVRWRAFQLEATIGLEDPADTGCLWGLIGPLLMVWVPPQSNVTVRPDFQGAALSFQSEGDLRLIPLRVILVLFRFSLSPATWKLLWSARRTR